jgi:FtsP/CotA-like multicopper oxidase with cupredoxin domain
MSIKDALATGAKHMQRRSVVAQVVVGLVIVLTGVSVIGCAKSAAVPTAIPTADKETLAAQPTMHAVAAIQTPAASPTPVLGCRIQDLNLDSNGAGADFKEPDVIAAVNGVVSATLTVKYGDNVIGECPVHLRSYNGKLVGPTLRARPGDTLRITLVNKLPSDDGEMHHVMNTIGDLNHTNLHTHGLHVSPAGNSDNVLLDIAPNETFDYEIKIPPDHVPGTYWYHAHMHGSTATQVSSGMEGALIIMGDTIPNTVDSLPDVKNATEKVLVFQQIVFDEVGVIEPTAEGGGTFPSKPDLTYFGPCNWEPMKREHTINGQLFPTLTLAPGEVQRWRLIDAGIRESIGVELRGPYTGPGNPSINDVLNLPTNNLNEIAVDGIPLSQVDAWQQVDLEPGYRSDVLVQLTKPGRYFLVDNGVVQTIVTRDPITGVYAPKTYSSEALTCPTGPGQPYQGEIPSFLATVIVSGDAKNMSLPTTAQMANLPLPYKPIIQINPAKTAPNAQGTPEPISPYSEDFIVALEEIDAFQYVDFSVSVHPAIYATAIPSSGPTPTPLSKALAFNAADHPFDPNNVRRLQLGNTEEWILNTQADSLYYAHPFHIHINPFQTWRPGPDGAPQTVWRDTILVKQGVPTYVFTRYQDYIGKFVYHCHILDHEDSGMMEAVEIVNP